MISEQFMQLGRWDLRLSPDTPMAVRQGFQEHDTILVTPTRVPAHASMTVSELADVARYRAPVLTISDDRTDIGGPGIMWYGNDGSGNGAVDLPPPTSSYTWAQHLNDLASFFSATGYTKATPVSVPAATWPAAGGLSEDLPVNVFERLTFLAETLGCEWRIDPDGTFRSGGANSSSLFQITPTVILQRSHEGRDLDLIGLRLVSLSRDIDASTRLTTGVVYDDAYAGSLLGVYSDTSTEPQPKNINGVNVTRNVVEFSSTIDNLTDGNARAQAIALAEPIQSVISATVDTYDPGRWMRPGDYLWVYDPVNKVYDNGEATTYHGQHVTPAKARLYGMDWSVRRGMGVYVAAHDGVGGDEIIDLTDYVVFEDSPCRLDLGAWRRSYDQ